MKKRILSGMRPTGPLHVGHLAGALANWVSLQDEYECLYMVADWHALMSDYENPEMLGRNTLEMIVDWLAAGLDPSRSVIFVQSKVFQHLELFMILSCITPISWLERCPTYKEALNNIHDKDIRNYAFLGYPVLQAADILLYRADAVPVGEDQLPHLEMTREIARRFNNFYGQILPEPKALLTSSAKLPGTDGRKMSKSYNNCIYLSDDPATVKKRVKSMITDPARIRADDPGHPDVCSVFSFHTYASVDEMEEIKSQCVAGKIGCVACKERLVSNLGGVMGPVYEKRQRWISRRSDILDILEAGRTRASDIAAQTMGMVRKGMKGSL